METVWLIIGVLAFVTLVILIFRKIRPWWKKIIMILLSTTVLGVSTFQVFIPIHPMPEITGEYTVTTSKESFYYETAEYETSDDEREVPVTIWHPEEISQIKGPLILFSHGSLGVSDSNDTLFTELASHGYVVASLAHPYHSFVATLEDGSTIMIDQDYLQNTLNSQNSEDIETVMNDFKSWSKLHEDDLTAVIEQIQAGQTENEFLSAVNSSELLLMGHSLGGSSALALARKRDDIIAVVALESPFIGDIEGLNEEENGYEFTNAPFPVPILHIYSDVTWYHLSADELEGWVIYEQNWNYLHSDDANYQNVHINGSGHIGLTDLHRVSPRLVNIFDGGLNTTSHDEVLTQINKNVLEFIEAQ